MPIFHGGGTLKYVVTPGFGFLIGFIPAAWLSGRLAQKTTINNLIDLTFCALAGVIILQVFGSLYLVIGSLLSIWPDTLLELIFSYSLAPLAAQLALCPAVGIISLTVRRLLLIE